MAEIKIKHLNLKTFDISKREELLDLIYPVVTKIFKIERSALIKSLFHQVSATANIYLFYDKKELVGINLTNIYEFNYKGKDHSFFRFLSGILPKYRGESNVQKVGFTEAFKYAALNPLRTIFYLGPLIHPSSYAAACKISNNVYPSLKKKVIPKKYYDLVLLVSDILGWDRVDGESPLIRDIHVSTIENENYTPKRISKRAEYFLKLNPNYAKGYGLVTIIPMDIQNVSSSFLKYYAKNFKIPYFSL